MTGPAAQDAPSRSETAAPGSYRLIIPPAWTMIPAGAGSDAAIDRLLDEQFEGRPRDSTSPHRSRLADILRDLAAEARDAGAIDLVFPLGTPWLVPVSAGVVMSVTPGAALRGPQTDLSGTQAIEELAQGSPGSTIVATKAGNALREVVDHFPLSGPDARRDGDPDAIERLRTTYHTWRLPGGAAGFLVGSLTISGQPIAEFAPIVDALTELVDVMMETLVFTAKPAAATAAGTAAAASTATRGGAR